MPMFVLRQGLLKWLWSEVVDSREITTKTDTWTIKYGVQRLGEFVPIRILWLAILR